MIVVSIWCAGILVAVMLLFCRMQVISDFDEMKKLIAKLHVSLDEEDEDEEDEENEAFLERYIHSYSVVTSLSIALD